MSEIMKHWHVDDSGSLGLCGRNLECSEDNNIHCLAFNASCKEKHMNLLSV